MSKIFYNLFALKNPKWWC